MKQLECGRQSEERGTWSTGPWGTIQQKEINGITVLANLFAFSICIVWVSKGQEVSEGNCVVFKFLPQYQKSGQIKK